MGGQFVSCALDVPNGAASVLQFLHPEFFTLGGSAAEISAGVAENSSPSFRLNSSTREFMRQVPHGIISMAPVKTT